MRAYRNGGRVAVILRLTLPAAESEGEAELAISEFYFTLAQAYLKGAEQLLAVSKNSDKAPISLCVDYAFEDSYHHDDIIAIKRFLRVNAGGVPQKYEVLDLFDVKSGLLLKRAHRTKSKKVKKKSPD